MPIGVLVNSSIVLLGGFLGAAIGKHIPKDITEQLPSVFGLSAIAISITLIIQIVNLTPVIIALIFGAVIGELIGIEQKIKSGVHKLVLMGEGGNHEKTEMLIVVIVLFCFSGTGIFGALNEGFSGDSSVLIAKSAMDFFTAIIFGASAGYLVGMVAIPQCLLGIILFASAGFVIPLLTPEMLGDFKACGGLLTLASGLKVANIKHMRVLNMLPALILVMFLTKFWMSFF